MGEGSLACGNSRVNGHPGIRAVQASFLCKSSWQHRPEHLCPQLTALSPFTYINMQQCWCGPKASFWSLRINGIERKQEGNCVRSRL